VVTSTKHTPSFCLAHFLLNHMSHFFKSRFVCKAWFLSSLLAQGPGEARHRVAAAPGVSTGFFLMTVANRVKKILGCFTGFFLMTVANRVRKNPEYPPGEARHEIAAAPGTPTSAGPHRRAAGGAPPETATSAAAGHGESRLYPLAVPVGIIRKFR